MTASGVLLMVIAAFVILRTVTKDSTDRTLVQRLLGASRG